MLCVCLPIQSFLRHSIFNQTRPKGGKRFSQGHNDALPSLRSELFAHIHLAAPPLVRISPLNVFLKDQVVRNS